jgi:hypothetical protein
MNVDEYNYILNGRVNLFDSHSTTAKILNNDPRLYNENDRNTISRVYSGTSVSETFFSKENINLIQEGIINTVFNRSNGVYEIGKQSDQELNIIMRSIYLQEGKNLNYDIKTQVRELNTQVIKWCVDEIIKNIKQYMEYKKSVSTLPMPMEHSLLLSQKGTKSLELKY